MTSLDHIILSICAWWRARCLEKAIPEIADLNRQEKAAIRAHKPVKGIRKRRQDAMTRALKEGK